MSDRTTITFDKVEMVKQSVDIVVGTGVGQIISGIVDTNVTTTNRLGRFTVFAAKMVIASMASEQTKKYTDEKIDNTIKWWEEVKNVGRTEGLEGSGSSEQEPQSEVNEGATEEATEESIEGEASD